MMYDMPCFCIISRPQLHFQRLHSFQPLRPTLPTQQPWAVCNPGHLFQHFSPCALLLPAVPWPARSGAATRTTSRLVQLRLNIRWPECSVRQSTCWPCVTLRPAALVRRLLHLHSPPVLSPILLSPLSVARCSWLGCFHAVLVWLSLILCLLFSVRRTTWWRRGWRAPTTSPTAQQVSQERARGAAERAGRHERNRN